MDKNQKKDWEVLTAHFNKGHYIKFTCEYEKDNYLAFVDCALHS